MAKPADVERFVLFEMEDLQLYIERDLVEAAEPIEFLIPHFGNFVLEPED